MDTVKATEEEWLNMEAWNPKEAQRPPMRILDGAGKKIHIFNRNYTDHSRQDYHSVLLARRGDISLVDINGLVNSQNLLLIDRALRGYFMMNRGNRMGMQRQFMLRLGSILSSSKVRSILVGLRNITIMSPNLGRYRPSSKDLYDALSSPQHGLSVDGTYFCVGATKVMHMLFPELFVMLDKNVGNACGYSPGQYNNFQAYWNVMMICHSELKAWVNKYGGVNGLFLLDPLPTSITRVFDKCATRTR
jgi:hypothetical protein